MSAKSNKCDYLRVELDKIKTDRLVIAGRRGTGKSTGLKQMINEGAAVVWVVDTKELAQTLPGRFVPAATAKLLPVPEPVDAGDVYPLFRFGDGAVRVVTWRQIPQLRDTGLSVDDRQADAIIRDEVFRTDGAYQRNEPELLDDLAFTLGRSGKTPVIICAGNPPERNATPYSFIWRCNVLNEGLYKHDGLTTFVRGTADCKDCFGRVIGRDALTAVYARHLATGGTVVSVDNVNIRIRPVASGLYVGKADDELDAHILMQRGRWTIEALSPKGTHFIMDCRKALDANKVVFDSFDAEVAFYRLLRVSV